MDRQGIALKEQRTRFINDGTKKNRSWPPVPERVGHRWSLRYCCLNDFGCPFVRRKWNERLGLTIKDGRIDYLL